MRKELNTRTPKCAVINISSEREMDFLGEYRKEAIYFDSIMSLPRELSRIKPDLVVLNYHDLRKLDFESIVYLESRKATASLPILLIGNEKPNFPFYPSYMSWVACALNQKHFKIVARALLRRVRPVSLEDELTCGQLKLNQSSFLLTCGSYEVPLNKRDLCYISPFFDDPDRIYDREFLISLIHEMEEWNDNIRNIDSYLSQFRRKVKKKLDFDPLCSDRGLGYRMNRGA